MSTPEKPDAAKADAAASEDLKRKFKEALDKKNAKHREGEAHLDGDSPVHGSHGPVSSKREFRREERLRPGMVFDPTFHEIDREADQLPDLSGDEIEIDPDAAEGEAGAEIAAGDVKEDDLPPIGED